MTSYKRTFVPQIDARDCGVAALASIAKFSRLLNSMVQIFL